MHSHVGERALCSAYVYTTCNQVPMLCSLSAFICMMYSDSSPVFPVGHVAPVGDVSAFIYQAAVGNHGPRGPDHMVRQRAVGENAHVRCAELTLRLLKSPEVQYMCLKVLCQPTVPSFYEESKS